MNLFKALAHLCFCFILILSLTKATKSDPKKKVTQWKIIEGIDAVEGRHNSYVSLEFEAKNTFCGGSLIAPSIVLTAAHCVDIFDASFSQSESLFARQISVRIGLFDSTDGTEVNDVIGIEAVKMHPGYNTNTLNRDFALIKLERDSQFDPIPIDQGICGSDGPNAGTPLTVMGFGNILPSGDPGDPDDLLSYYRSFEAPDVLQTVDVASISNNDCEELYEGPNALEWDYALYDKPIPGGDAEAFFDSLSVNQQNKFDFVDITPQMMCSFTAEKDSCQGDSGGPLIIKGNGNTESDLQVGVVSFGIGCGSAFPGVYARISSEFDFISETINSCDFFKEGTSNELSDMPSVRLGGCDGDPVAGAAALDSSSCSEDEDIPTAAIIGASIAVFVAALVLVVNYFSKQKQSNGNGSSNVPVAHYAKA